MTRFRSAVVGCGAISQEHLGFLSGSQLAHLVGACDRSPTAVEHACNRFGVAAGYTDVAIMLEEAAPDVVHVLTPPATHAKLVKQCMEAGADVLCEKPIALTAAELADLHECSATTGKRYMENHNYLYNDEIRSLDFAVARGMLGPVRAVDVSLFVPMPDSDLGAPAGAVHDYVTHAAYLVLHFLGVQEVDFVRAHWALVSTDPALRYDELAAIIGAGSATATIRISGAARPMQCRVTVSGTRGRGSVDLFQPEYRVDVDEPDNPLRPLASQVSAGVRLLNSSARNLRSKLLQRGAIHGLPRLLEAFYLALAEGRDLPVSETDMRGTSQLIDALVSEAGL